MRKLVVVFWVIVLAACTSIDCPVQNTVYTIYDLKKADGTTDTLTKDTLWVWTERADGSDTIISRRDDGSLVLNYFHGSTATTLPETEEWTGADTGAGLSPTTWPILT